MGILVLFDNDGVLRDESQSYERAVANSVEILSDGEIATHAELISSRKATNNDWERVFYILKDRGVFGEDEQVENRLPDIKKIFQRLYLGDLVNGRYTGYIKDETWLADNNLLRELARFTDLAIVSGAPLDEIEYTKNRNEIL